MRPNRGVGRARNEDDAFGCSRLVPQDGYALAGVFLVAPTNHLPRSYQEQTKERSALTLPLLYTIPTNETRPTCGDALFPRFPAQERGDKPREHGVSVLKVEVVTVGIAGGKHFCFCYFDPRLTIICGLELECRVRHQTTDRQDPVLTSTLARTDTMDGTTTSHEKKVQENDIENAAVSDDTSSLGKNDILQLEHTDPVLNAKMHLINNAIGKLVLQNRSVKHARLTEFVDDIGFTPYQWKRTHTPRISEA